MFHQKLSHQKRAAPRPTTSRRAQDVMGKQARIGSPGQGRARAWGLKRPGEFHSSRVAEGVKQTNFPLHSSASRYGHAGTAVSHSGQPRVLTVKPSPKRAEPCRGQARRGTTIPQSFQANESSRMVRSHRVCAREKPFDVTIDEVNWIIRSIRRPAGRLARLSGRIRVTLAHRHWIRRGESYRLIKYHRDDLADFLHPLRPHLSRRKPH